MVLIRNPYLWLQSHWKRIVHVTFTTINLKTVTEVMLLSILFRKDKGLIIQAKVEAVLPELSGRLSGQQIVHSNFPASTASLKMLLRLPGRCNLNKMNVLMKHHQQRQWSSQ